MMRLKQRFPTFLYPRTPKHKNENLRTQNFYCKKSRYQKEGIGEMLFANEKTVY